MPATVLRHPLLGIELRVARSAADTDGELLEMEATYPPASAPPPAHFHPRQEERFLVRAGEMRVKIDGRLLRLAAGDTLTIPAGTPHSMWNPGPAAATVNWQTRPALRTQQFFEELYGLAESGRTDAHGRPGLLDLAVLVPRYWQEMRVTRPSPLVQRLLFGILRPIALLLGRGRRPARVGASP